MSSQRKVTFRLAPCVSLYKKRRAYASPGLSAVFPKEMYSGGGGSGSGAGAGDETPRLTIRASDPVPPPPLDLRGGPGPTYGFMGIYRDSPPESPVPPPPPAWPESLESPPRLDLRGGPGPTYGFTGLYRESPPESPVPPPPAPESPVPPPPEPVVQGFARPPPLNLIGCMGPSYGFGAASSQGLDPIKKPLHYEPDEPPPSWTCSPISPATHDEWLRARVEEAAIRADALAQAHNEFSAHITPQSQRTPASVYGHRAGSPMQAMSPLVMTPRAEEDLAEVMDGMRLVIVERHDELQ